MGAIESLAELEAFLEKSNAPFVEREPVRWAKLKDNQTIKASILQEIDPDSPNYDEAKGKVLIIVEHSNPENFRKKAVCTAADEGRCYGCERHKADPKAGWKGKARFYANAIIEDGVEEPYLAILSQSTTDRSIVPTLAMAAAEDKTITDIKWKIKRSGVDTGTSYSAFPLGKEKALDGSGFVLYDLRKVATRDVPYAEQEEFYTGDSTGGSTPAPAAAQSTNGIDW